MSGEESRDSDKVDTDDEGIEQDHDDERSSNASSTAGSSSNSNNHPRNQAENQDCMASILGLCESHLSVESEAEAHYRNVCRALVSEALELSFFLKKTLVRAEEHSEELQQLALKDWVRFLPFLRPLHSVTLFENDSNCRIRIFEFWHFPPIFVLLKLTCLVTLFDRKLQVFKNSPK